jgi:hypothetical protein
MNNRFRDCSSCENFKECLFKDEADPQSCESSLNTDAGFDDSFNNMNEMPDTDD